MEWLFGLALLPVLLCGAMCAGGALLAFVGVKRARRPSCNRVEHRQEHRDDAEPAGTP